MKPTLTAVSDGKPLTDSVERLLFKLLVLPTIPLKKMDKGCTGHYPNSAGESRPSCDYQCPAQPAQLGGVSTHSRSVVHRQRILHRRLVCLRRYDMPPRFVHVFVGLGPGQGLKPPEKKWIPAQCLVVRPGIWSFRVVC